MVLQLNENMNNFEKPEIFTQKLETLQSQLPSILDDFSKYYVLFNKSPENPEYQQAFQNIKSNLNNIYDILEELKSGKFKNFSKIYTEYYIRISNICNFYNPI